MRGPIYGHDAPPIPPTTPRDPETRLAAAHSDCLHEHVSCEACGERMTAIGPRIQPAPSADARYVSLDEAGPGFLRANTDYQGEAIIEVRSTTPPQPDLIDQDEILFTEPGVCRWCGKPYPPQPDLAALDVERLALALQAAGAFVQFVMPFPDMPLTDPDRLRGVAREYAALAAADRAGTGLDVDRLAEAIAVFDLHIPADDTEQRRLWRETPAQLEQARKVAAEYARLATPEPQP